MFQRYERRFSPVKNLVSYSRRHHQVDRQQAADREGDLRRAEPHGGDELQAVLAPDGGGGVRVRQDRPLLLPGPLDQGQSEIYIQGVLLRRC